MFGFLKNLFASPEAKAEALVKKRASAKQKAVSDARARALEQIRDQSGRIMTPERQALIQKAMTVKRAKQKILDDLDDESRAKLVALAITTLLHQGDGKQEPKAASSTSASSNPRPANAARPNTGHSKNTGSKPVNRPKGR